MGQEKLPVQFIRCTEEDIQKMKSKFDEGTNKTNFASTNQNDKYKFEFRKRTRRKSN